MKADQHGHSVEVQEIRTANMGAASGSVRLAESPPVSLFYDVDAETFSQFRIGQEFELSPMPHSGVVLSPYPPGVR